MHILKKWIGGGYNSYYQVLNAKNYGIPQNRERVFTISIRKDIDTGYTFPEPIPLKLKLKDFLEDNVDEKYYLSNKAIEGRMTTHYQKYKLENNIINDKDIHPTILARYEGAPTLLKVNVIGNYMPSNYESSRIVDSNGLAPTIKENHGTVTATNVGLKIRRLTPKECWRLMGFDDEDFDKAAQVNSNAQLYKQAGNSIVVNVIEYVLAPLNLEKENK